MFKISFILFAIILLGIGVFTVVLRNLYYYRKYRDAYTDEDKIRRFIWDWLPGLYRASDEDFFLFLKWWIILLFWISLAYLIFVKIPIPFVGKPLFVIEGLG